MDKTQNKPTARRLTDGFGRDVTYLRLSVTDRCDMRCSYCMAENMVFLPRESLLSLEELTYIAEKFIERGTKKIRITGGEPLVRKNVLSLFDKLGSQLGNGLDELTLTTNASLLDRHAQQLVDAGVRRVNISLDSIDPERFREITRRGDFAAVMRGIDAAVDAGLKIKINTVALRNGNVAEIPQIVAWAHERCFDMTLIEVMPLGDTGDDRIDQYVPLMDVRRALEEQWDLHDEATSMRNAGPARYVQIAETGGRLGFITPLTNNFCAGCNRVRVTCTGRIYMCLGQDDHVDLRAALRGSENTDVALDAALDRALGAKPEKHDFFIRERGAAPSLPRHMSQTGG